MGDLFNRLSWDDLRIVRAIGNTGALSLAAEKLNVNSSTIARRLDKIEEVLAVRLFDRRRTGYVATPQGGELMALAERVELDVVSVARKVSGNRQGHSGDLRVTASDSILQYFLIPILASFKALNPEIKIEVAVGNASLNLARGESDIAIRATEKPPENLFGRKVGTIAWAPYANLSTSELCWRQPSKPFDQPWVSYCGHLSSLKAVKFISARVAPDNISFRTDSVAGAAAAIAAGLGIGFLPCMLGDISRDLVRVGQVESELIDELWLLTHPDIRKSDRIYAFMSHCVDAISKERDLIEGRSGVKLRHLELLLNAHVNSIPRAE